MGRIVKMSGKGKGHGPDLPYFLTDGETRRHGVDIGRALQSGFLTQDDFLAVLAYCRACEAGPRLRSEPGHDLGAAETPDWCANREVLEGLRGIV
ncbi:MAG: DUF6455 family protein [Paracoccaceae bacterium]